MKFNIIQLDCSWTKCAVCHKDIPTGTGFALPMYEGEVSYRSHVCFPVCEECYVANNQEGIIFE